MISIRPTVAEDADTLCALQKAAFLPIYEQYHDEGNPCLRGPEDILKRLDSATFKYYTILVDGEIAGGVLYRRAGRTPFVAELKPGEYYLLRIYVKPDLQCRGIGAQAILLCEKEFPDAVKFYVDFPKELVKNRKCYEKAGFRDSGEELEASPGLILAGYEKSM